MIYFYSGTPGSGKSLHCAKDIYNKLFVKKQNVIANFEINERMLAKKKRRGDFVYISNFEMSPNYLLFYALPHIQINFLFVYQPIYQIGLSV